MNMSFFHKRTRSGTIRGAQMAEYLGAKVNPTEGYEDDVCIYVKTPPPLNYPKRTYLDIMDGPRLVGWAAAHPDVSVIASSLTGYEYLSEKLENEVILIPQHHCNYDREVKQERNDVVGVIGGKGAIQTALPFDYVHCIKYKTRQDVIEFYRTIDIQVVWRPMNRPLKNPLKIVNAMSFGIPTVAFPEMAYKEVEGYYAAVKNVDTMAAVLDTMKNYTMNPFVPSSRKLLEKAEEYHISSIAELYKELL